MCSPVRWLVWLCLASTICWAQLDNLRPLRGILHDLGGPEQAEEQPRQEQAAGGFSVDAPVAAPVAVAAAAFGDGDLGVDTSIAPDPVALTEALEVGLSIAQGIIDQETGGGALRTDLGVAQAAVFVGGQDAQFRPELDQPPPSQGPLEQSSVFLFSFRKAEPEAKRSASCQGRLLLEASKFIMRRFSIAAQNAQPSLTQLNTLLDESMCQTLTPRGCEEAEPPPQCSASQPYRTVDGSCNNLQNPKWGESMIPFVRYLAPAYEDGVDAMRGEGRTGDRVLPSPRDVSRALHEGEQRAPLPYLTLLVMQWGQFLDHDLVHTPEAADVDVDGETMPRVCCREGVPSAEDLDVTGDCRPIDVSADPLFTGQGRSCMRFVRSLIASRDCLLGPREQLNQITSYIDGSMVYGSTPEVARMLRTMVGGKLNKTVVGVGGRHLLPLVDCEHTQGFCFKAGDERVNEQPGLASMHTLWLRLHDSIVTQLADHNPHWNDETLYQEARRIVGALIQQITYQEFLQIVLGNEKMEEYDLFPQFSGLADTYDPTEDASISNAFGTAAYRFGHTLVNDFLKGSGKNVPLSGNFMNPRVLREAGSSPSDLLHGLANSLSQGVDSYLVPTLTNKLFARRDEPVGLDLMSLNIQRGRDHGLPPYTVWRRACGLPTLSSFSQLASVMSPNVAQTFSTVYRNVDDIDLFPAGLAEHPVPGALLGPTFSCILAQQFSSLKKGDRFWFENRSQPKPFTLDQLASIRSLSLASLMCEHMNLRQLQPHPFITPDIPGNHPQPCSTYPKLITGLWREEVPVPHLPCHGVGVWRSLPGIDYWCTLNCLRHISFCPLTHCYCSHGF